MPCFYSARSSFKGWRGGGFLQGGRGEERRDSSLLFRARPQPRSAVIRTASSQRRRRSEFAGFVSEFLLQPSLPPKGDWIRYEDAGALGAQLVLLERARFLKQKLSGKDGS